MPVANLIAKLRPPQGLAARAVVFTSGVMLATAVMCVTVVLWGAQRESARRPAPLLHVPDPGLAAFGQVGRCAQRLT